MLLRLKELALVYLTDQGSAEPARYPDTCPANERCLRPDSGSWPNEQSCNQRMRNGTACSRAPGLGNPCRATGQGRLLRPLAGHLASRERYTEQSWNVLWIQGPNHRGSSLKPLRKSLKIGAVRPRKAEVRRAERSERSIELWRRKKALEEPRGRQNSCILQISAMTTWHSGSRLIGLRERSQK